MIETTFNSNLRVNCNLGRVYNCTGTLYAIYNCPGSTHPHPLSLSLSAEQQDNQSIANNLISMQCSNFLYFTNGSFIKLILLHRNKNLFFLEHLNIKMSRRNTLPSSSGNIVTTCGVTSIKHSPGDARQPISAAKLTDQRMQVSKIDTNLL